MRIADAGGLREVVSILVERRVLDDALYAVGGPLCRDAWDIFEAGESLIGDPPPLADIVLADIWRRS